MTVLRDIVRFFSARRRAREYHYLRAISAGAVVCPECGDPGLHEDVSNPQAGIAFRCRLCRSLILMRDHEWDDAGFLELRR